MNVSASALNGVLIQAILWLCLGSYCFAIQADVSADTEPPNIVLILADDMGYADAGFNGCQDIQTPNLDRLAKSGVIFTQGYCNHPFCAPSRAALLSGRYHTRFGFEDNPAYDPANPYLGIDPREKLFPQRLREAGYKTGCIGKWHLGAAPPFHPNHRGFDYFYGFLGGGHDYFEIDVRRPVRSAYFQPLIRNRKPAEFDGYLTTALSRDAVQFIDTNQDQPFFLFLSYNAPHTPLQAPPEAIARYAHIENDKRRVYAAMVDTMDRGIGMVLDALRTNGLRENTLVFFLSDNGGPINMSWNPNYSNGSSNAPFRGGKTNLYEGGLRVPFVASWPARIPAGRQFNHPVMSLDISRTVVECAGADPIADQAMEGTNLLPYLTGQSAGPPHELIYWRDEDGARWCVLSADGHKYLVDTIGGPKQLFHLPGDLTESRNLAQEKPDVATRMFDRWVQWNTKNVAGRIESYMDYFKKRDEFFRDSIAPKAKQEGYDASAMDSDK